MERINGGQQGEGSSAMIMAKILSFNTKGLGIAGKLDKILTWSTHLSIDIFMLQETHSSKKTEREWESKWGEGKNIIRTGKPINGGWQFS